MRQENECIARDWKLIPFSSNIEMLSGFPFDSKHFNESEGKPLIRIRNIISGETETYYKGEYSDEYLITKGDILVGMDGDFHIKKWQGSESLLNQRILKLYENRDSEINMDFFYYLSQPFLLKVHKRTAGTTVKHLSTKDYKNASFKVPVYAEQQKIADILSTVDAKIEVIDQQITETQELKKGLMQRLLTKGVGHTEFKDSPLGKIPKSWEVRALDKIGIELIDGDRGINYPKSKDFSSEGFCLFLSAKNVTKNGFKFDECQFISEERNDLLRKGKLSKYDFIITTRGSVGHVAFFDDTVPYKHIRLNSGMVILRDSKKNFNTQFLYQLMRSPIFNLQVEFITSGSAQPQLTITGLKKLKLPIPSIKEQLLIGEVLTTISNKLEVLTEKKTYYQELKQGLMQQLLTGNIRVNTN